MNVEEIYERSIKPLSVPERLKLIEKIARDPAGELTGQKKPVRESAQNGMRGI